MTSPSDTPPADVVQFEYAITLRGPAADVNDVVQLLHGLRWKASRRYLDVRIDYLVEDMTHVR